jgi:hypothetical protein
MLEIRVRFTEPEGGGLLRGTTQNRDLPHTYHFVIAVQRANRQSAGHEIEDSIISCVPLSLGRHCCPRAGTDKDVWNADYTPGAV